MPDHGLPHHNGIDNAFGAVLLPILQSAMSMNALSPQASADYTTGKRTDQLAIKGLRDDPKQTTLGLGGGVFPSLAYKGDSPVDIPFPGAVPTTDWPVRVEGLADGATVAGGPKVAFGQAHVTNGTFVVSELDLPAGDLLRRRRSRVRHSSRHPHVRARRARHRGERNPRGRARHGGAHPRVQEQRFRSSPILAPEGARESTASGLDGGRFAHSNASSGVEPT